jgi:hypothetical protein
LIDYVSLESATPVKGVTLHDGDSISVVVQYNCNETSSQFYVSADLRDKNDNIVTINAVTYGLVNHNGTVTLKGVFHLTNYDYNSSMLVYSPPYTIELAVGYYIADLSFYQDASYDMENNYYN